MDGKLGLKPIDSAWNDFEASKVGDCDEPGVRSSADGAGGRVIKHLDVLVECRAVLVAVLTQLSIFAIQLLATRRLIENIHRPGWRCCV